MCTSFQAFKFIELYSMIQFWTVIQLYCVGACLTDTQFLYIDLVALVPLSVFQAWTGAYEKLSKDVPTASLFYMPVVLSVIISSLIQLLFQVFLFTNVREQPFYQPPFDVGDTIEEMETYSYEDTVLFIATNFQYLMTCISFSVAKPYRKPVWTNKPFLISLVALAIFNAYLVFTPDHSRAAEFFDFRPLSLSTGPNGQDYHYFIALVVVCNCVATYAAEKVIVQQVTKAEDKKQEESKRIMFDRHMMELAQIQSKQDL